MPLKILFLSHFFYPSIGGIETISELLANSFSDAGHEVHVLTWSDDLTNKPFKFTITRNPGWKKICKEHAWADVIFENNPCIRLSWPRLIYKRNSFVVLQTWLPKISGGFASSSRFKLLHLKMATKVIAISKAIRNECWPAATVIGNSYNVDDFKIIPGIQRNKDFVFVGRLVSDKGVDLAIKALHVLVSGVSDKEKRDKQYKLTIIGDGPDRAALVDLVTELQLQDYVEFTGSLRGKELAQNLNKHRFILVPSVWKEPFGIVALEGMACGCLPIVSDGGGLPDAVGNAGLSFTSGNVESLVKTILDVMNNPQLEQQLRSAAKKHLMEHHPYEISQKYLNMIYSAASQQ